MRRYGLLVGAGLALGVPDALAMTGLGGGGRDDSLLNACLVAWFTMPLAAAAAAWLAARHLWPLAAAALAIGGEVATAFADRGDMTFQIPLWIVLLVFALSERRARFVGFLALVVMAVVAVAWAVLRAT